jgi:hypothetical protein
MKMEKNNSKHLYTCIKTLRIKSVKNKLNEWRGWKRIEFNLIQKATGIVTIATLKKTHSF